VQIDLGDAVLDIRLRIPGLQRIHWRIRVGAPVEADDAVRADRARGQRAARSGPSLSPRRKAPVLMDLQADKQVTLTGEWTDEVGNPVSTPDGASVTYTVDDTSVINLTDNGDGTAVAAATGTLGTANVHAEASSDGQAVTGDLQIVVVAGLAERFNITASEPTEVTPDA
jgi:hypothetical protein